MAEYKLQNEGNELEGPAEYNVDARDPLLQEKVKYLNKKYINSLLQSICHKISFVRFTQC